MQDRGYDLATARHYAAYRPPLHVSILTLGLREDKQFHQALDVGCGTGGSTHALSRWCNKVIGTDPSAAMIEMAQPTENVSFQQQPGDEIDTGLEKNAFDLVVFAGSLFYLETKAVLTSLEGLLVPGGTVIVYDFDVLLQPVFDHLGILMPESNYNHAKKLPCNKESFLRFEKSVFGNEKFSLTATELAHLLCAVADWRKGALANYSFTDLVDLLPTTTTLKAKTWLTRYAV